MPGAAVSIDGAPEPSRSVFAASPGFFTTLGVAAERGRLTSDASAAVLSDRFFRARFHGDARAIGTTVVVGEEAYPIIGVAAPAFQGTSLDSTVDLWIMQPALQGSPANVFARLVPRVSVQHAQPATTAAFEQSPPPGPTGDPVITTVEAGGDGESNLRERYRNPLIALLGLVALVVLITCANLGNLLAVRNASRAHELRVRTALGASRSRLIGQLLVEGGLIAILGGVAAWWFAAWGVSALVSTLPSPQSAARLALQVDLRLLLFMAATTLAATLGFALLPALRATKIDVATALKSAPSFGAPAGARRLSQWMVGAQVALSVVLVAGAGLFIETVQNVAALDLGFDRKHIVEVELNDRVGRQTRESVKAAHDAMIAGLQAIPGVEAVTFSVPLFPQWAVGIDRPEGEAGYPVSIDYFKTFQIPLVRGRLLTADDLRRRDGEVVVVNEWYAKGWFPGEDAIGKRGGFSQGEIVGIVANAQTTNVRWEDPTVYRVQLPDAGRMTRAFAIRVRDNIDRRSLFDSIERVVRGVDPRLFVGVRTAEDALNRSIARERMVAATSALFGLIGLLLAGIGLFGVASAAVAQRTNEIGLRMALGAGRWNVMTEALRSTAIVFAIGLLSGVVLVFVATQATRHLVAELLIGLRPGDRLVLLATIATLLSSAALAALIPALRATRINPLDAIRHS
jgi:predicted permease